MFKLKSRSMALAGAALAAVLALTGCSGSTGASPDDGTKFVYDVGTAKPTLALSPFTAVPSAMGYWKDEGLDMELVYSNGSSAGLQSILAGRSDITVSGSNVTYSAALKNPELRIVSFVPKNLWRIAVPTDSGIKAAKDLKGKTVGVISMTSGSYIYGRSIVKAAGLNPDKDVQWLPVTDGSQATEAIESGRIDAYSSYDGPLDVVGELTKEGLRPLPSELDKIGGPLGYVVTKETLEKKPDEIEKFLRGVYEGMEFSATSPEAAVQIYWNEHPDQKPKAAAGEDIVAKGVAETKRAWENRASPGDEGIWGYLSPESVKLSVDYITKHKILEGDVNSDETVDMSVTRKATEFDVKKIQEDAKAWKP